jgi:hypothetical protein
VFRMLRGWAKAQSLKCSPLWLLLRGSFELYLINEFRFIQYSYVYGNLVGAVINGGPYTCVRVMGDGKKRKS